MDHYQDTAEILNLITQPAFRVHKGIIIQRNVAAERLLIETDTPVSSLIFPHEKQYAQFREGCLFLAISYNDHSYSASVSKVNGDDIFILDPDAQNKELRSLSLTASNMRQPLSAMVAAITHLEDIVKRSNDPKAKEQLAHMNRSLYQMHRMLCNMSDALQYVDGKSNNMSYQNIVSIAEEIFRKVELLAAYNSVHFEWSVPDDSIFSNVDAQLLERGIYNMISNALKFTPKNGNIYAAVKRCDNILYIHIKDNGNGIPVDKIGNIFQYYQRQPGLEDSRTGLGLGLVMVRAAALVHGGTVLVDQPDGIGTRITLSIPIRHSPTNIVRSQVFNIDYAGGWDHSLLELSDVLPAQLYNKNR